MIQRLEVKGLNNRLDGKFEFNEDLNIFTGPNGSGKTTLLKLIWYLISGNLEKILPEIPFKFVVIETDVFSVKITRNGSDKVNIDWKYLKEDWSNTYDIVEVEEIFVQLNKKISPAMKSSLFFPTFRRIEGGFSGVSEFADIDPRRYTSNRRLWKSSDFWFSDSLKDDMIVFPNVASDKNHKFIAAISTQDIDRLVKDIHFDISGEANKRHRKTSDEIIQEIRDYFDREEETDTQDLQEAKRLLDDTRKELEDVDKEREKLFQPITVLSEYVSEFFKDYGIRITDNITLGHDAEVISHVISSDKLSAGEKQMLSFLCYNAFYKDTAIFIDEPELSLHIDWQRLLLPTLLDQGTGNQFFIATHSPFIFSGYQHKEIPLEETRGDKGREI